MNTQTLPAPSEQWLTLTGEDLPKEVGQLQPGKVAALAELFIPFMQQVVELRKDAMDIEVTDEADAGGMRQARELRLAIKNIRVDADKIRKDEKQFSLITGRMVDFFGRSIRELAEVTENHLKEQETYAERMEAARLAELKNRREEELFPYVAEGMTFSNLDTMGEDEFQRLLQDTKDAHTFREQKRQEEEAARIAQEKAEAEERERLRTENEKLRAEAAARVEQEKQKLAAENEKAAESASREVAMREQARQDDAKAPRFALWQFFQEEHGLTLKDGQLDDIVAAVERYQKAVAASQPF